MKLQGQTRPALRPVSNDAGKMNAGRTAPKLPSTTETPEGPIVRAFEVFGTGRTATVFRERVIPIARRAIVGDAERSVRLRSCRATNESRIPISTASDTSRYFRSAAPVLRSRQPAVAAPQKPDHLLHCTRFRPWAKSTRKRRLNRLRTPDIKFALCSWNLPGTASLHVPSPHSARCKSCGSKVSS